MKGSLGRSDLAALHGLLVDNLVDSGLGQWLELRYLLLLHANLALDHASLNVLQLKLYLLVVVL